MENKSERIMEILNNPRLMFDAWITAATSNDSVGERHYANILNVNFGIDVDMMDEEDFFIVDRLIDRGLYNKEK